MFVVDVPRPDLTWVELDELLEDFLVGRFPEDAIAELVTVVAALLGGAEIGSHVIEGILLDAGLDLDDTDVKTAATSFVTSMQAAGLLLVDPLGDAF